jgi:hypothetical protein
VVEEILPLPSHLRALNRDSKCDTETANSPVISDSCVPRFGREEFGTAAVPVGNWWHPNDSDAAAQRKSGLIDPAVSYQKSAIARFGYHGPGIAYVARVP